MSGLLSERQKDELYVVLVPRADRYIADCISSIPTISSSLPFPSLSATLPSSRHIMDRQVQT